VANSGVESIVIIAWFSLQLRAAIACRPKHGKRLLSIL
jgi:hypothetical protein